MNRLKNLISIIVMFCFVLNTTISDYAFALATAPASTRPVKIQEICAAGNKEIAKKIGPGSIPFDQYEQYLKGHRVPRFLKNKLIGTPPEIPGVDFDSVDYNSLPNGWENNPILAKKMGLIKAFEYYRDHEAYLRGVYIKEGYWELEKEKDGEIPICRWETLSRPGKSPVTTLIIHTDFVRMWNEIRRNDVWFNYTYPDGELKGQTRTVSLAYGIFYRIAKHEMTDFRSKTVSLLESGHRIPRYTPLTYHADKKHRAYAHYTHLDGRRPAVRDDELAANQIGGNYARLDDSLWMLFLIHCLPGYEAKHDSKIARDRCLWLFGRYEGKNADSLNAIARELKLHEEFPNLMKDTAGQVNDVDAQDKAIDLAIAVGQKFYSNFRQADDYPYGWAAKREKLIEDYNERKQYIVGKPLYATGAEASGEAADMAVRKGPAAKKSTTIAAERAQSDTEVSILALINTDLNEAVKLLTLNHHELENDQLLRIATAIKKAYSGPIKIVGKIGGSTIAFEASTPAGLLGYRVIVNTNEEGDTEEDVVNRIAETILKVHKFYDSRELHSVYFTAPGFFDRNGKLTNPETNIPALKRVGFSFRVSVSKALKRMLKLKVVVDVVHDGTGGALGEVNRVYGTLPGDGDILYVIAGTGIGTRRLVNGKPVLGGMKVNYLINEAPHTLLFNGNLEHPDYEYIGLRTEGRSYATDRVIFDEDGNEVDNPRYEGEDLEDRTSGPGIARYAADELNRITADSSNAEYQDAIKIMAGIGNYAGNIDTKLLGIMANEGNGLAKRIIQDRARELGVGMAALIIAYEKDFCVKPPKHVVIGSGVAQIGEIFLQAVREGARARFSKAGVEYDIDSIMLSGIKDDTARELIGGLPDASSWPAGITSESLDETERDIFIAQLEDESSSWRNAALKALEARGLLTPELTVRKYIADLENGDRACVVRACTILARMGDLAQPAIPALHDTVYGIDIFQEGFKQRRAAYGALEKLGELTEEYKMKRYLADLSDAAEYDNGNEVYKAEVKEAIEWLARSGIRSDDVIKALIDALPGDNSDVARAALFTMGEAALGAIETLNEDECSEEVMEAAKLLAKDISENIYGPAEPARVSSVKPKRDEAGKTGEAADMAVGRKSRMGTSADDILTLLREHYGELPVSSNGFIEISAPTVLVLYEKYHKDWGFEMPTLSAIRSGLRALEGRGILKQISWPGKEGSHYSLVEPSDAEFGASALPTGADAKGLLEIIDEYTARVYANEGPQGETAVFFSQKTLELMGSAEKNELYYKFFNELIEQSIEIFIPRDVILTQGVIDAIDSLNDRIRERRKKAGKANKNIKAIKITQYNDRNLAMKLEDYPEKLSPVALRDYRRIFIANKSTLPAFRKIREEGRLDLLKGNKFINADIPQGKDYVENSVHQAWLMKVAMLSCLLTEKDSPTGRALEAELHGRLEGDDGEIKKFVEKMADVESESNNEDIVARVDFFIGKIVKLSTLIAQQLRILKAFWIAA